MNLLSNNKPMPLAALDIWENEGGSTGEIVVNNEYGRRIEADRTWTIYHVFTGAPAIIDGTLMTGLSAATSLNCLGFHEAYQPAVRQALPLPVARGFGSWFKRKKIFRQ